MLQTQNWKRNYKEISILITVLPHVYKFMCLFAFVFFLADKCFFFMSNLGFLEITEWEPWQTPKVHNVRKCIMVILGLRCPSHVGIRIIRFKSHAVSEICIVVFVWHEESVWFCAVGCFAVSTKSATQNVCYRASEMYVPM